MNVWFVYVDYTDGNRPFYVGKGNESRIKEKERNSDWKLIAEEFGQHRQVVYSSKDEDDAYAAEKWLVAYHNTFHGWGANLNEGGRGQKSGWKHTIKTRQAIGDKHKERKFSPETLERIRVALTGRKIEKPAWNRGKSGPSPANKGVPMSEEQKQHLSKLNKGKPSNRKGIKLSDETKQKLSESHKGQKAWNKKFTDEIVDAMLKDREFGMMIKEIASKYETSTQTVCRLLKTRKENNG